MSLRLRSWWPIRYVSVPLSAYCQPQDSTLIVSIEEDLLNIEFNCNNECNEETVISEKTVISKEAVIFEETTKQRKQPKTIP